MWEKAQRRQFHVGACSSPSLITGRKVPRPDVDKQVGNELTAPRQPVPPPNPGDLNNLRAQSAGVPVMPRGKRSAYFVRQQFSSYLRQS